MFVGVLVGVGVSVFVGVFVGVGVDVLVGVGAVVSGLPRMIIPIP